MPTYQFRNKETNEVIEKILKISDRELFLENNPNFEPYHSSAPSLGDPIRLGIIKPDNGFKEVLQKINERNPNNTLSKYSSRDF